MIIRLLLYFYIFLAVDNKKSFSQAHTYASIELTYVIQPNVSKVRYTIQQDTITIAELKNSITGDSILYKSVLTNQQISDYYKKISSLKIDTLEHYYDGGAFDGFDLGIKVNSVTGINQFIGLHNFRHPIITMLIDETNKLIPESRLQLRIISPVLLISGDNDGLDKVKLMKTYQLLGGGIAADMAPVPKNSFLK